MLQTLYKASDFLPIRLWIPPIIIARRHFKVDTPITFMPFLVHCHLYGGFQTAFHCPVKRAIG
jgi:hypothetical protein